MRSVAISVESAFGPNDAIRMEPARGYDLAADFYDNWSWQAFWRTNEFPIVCKLILESPPKHGVLDIGVGTGAFLSYLDQYLTPEVPLAGIDVSQKMLRHARRRLEPRATLVRADVQNGLPFKSASFDAVVMMRVANHLCNLDQLLSEINRVLSHRGTLVVTDLAEEFDYVCTKIPTPKMAVNIETYKHSRIEWRRSMRSAGFSGFKRFPYKAAKLINPNAGNLGSKLGFGGAPIFEVIAAQSAA